MTREEEEAKVVEIEAMPRVSSEFKFWFRKGMERAWMLEDAGVVDLGAHRLHRTLERRPIDNS